MSKISKEGFEQIQVIKNALDSMYDKLNGKTFYTKNESKKVKNIEEQYTETNVFELVQTEFGAISDIISKTGDWEEVE